MGSSRAAQHSGQPAAVAAMESRRRVGTLRAPREVFPDDAHVPGGLGAVRDAGAPRRGGRAGRAEPSGGVQARCDLARWPHLAWVEAAPTPAGPSGRLKIIRLADRGGGAPVRITAARDGVDHEEDQPVFSPDGKRLAFLSDAEQDGQPQLYVADVGSGAVRRLTQASGHLERPLWSPDGKRLSVLYLEGAADALGPLGPAARETGVIGSVVREQRIALVSAEGGTLSPVSPEDLFVYEYCLEPGRHRVRRHRRARLGGRQLVVRRAVPHPRVGRGGAGAPSPGAANLRAHLEPGRDARRLHRGADERFRGERRRRAGGTGRRWEGAQRDARDARVRDAAVLDARGRADRRRHRRWGERLPPGRPRPAGRAGDAVARSRTGARAVAHLGGLRGRWSDGGSRPGDRRPAPRGVGGTHRPLDAEVRRPMPG